MSILKKVGFGVLIMILGVGLYKLSELYSPGSYPNVEIYGFDVNEDNLLKGINEFKAANPKYIPPKNFHLEEGRKNVNDHWFSIYFYYPDSKELIYVWTRPKGINNYTTLGFVSVNKGDKLGNWQDINKDFSPAQNSIQKKKFETLILNPIKKIVSGRE